MRNAPLDRDRKKLLDQFLRAPDQLNAELRHGFCLHHRRKHENAAPFSAKGRHQSAVIKLAHNARRDGVAGKPRFKLLAHGGVGALNKHRDIAQARWEFSFKLFG